jgi:hypothetical protein
MATQNFGNGFGLTGQKITGASGGFGARTTRALRVPEGFRKISQNFSPAGVTSPFVARAMPMDANSVVPVTGR